MPRSLVRSSSIGLALLLTMLLLGSPGCGCGSDDIYAVAPKVERDLVECPPIDIVFLLDTSGSMDDEAVALCSAIGQVEDDLEARGADVARVSLFGITEDANEIDSDNPEAFSCLASHVAETYGTNVPGSPPPAVAFLQDNESWSAATAIVAGEHPWIPGTIRLIVPISDEGPFDGDPCDDPGDDRTSIEHSIDVSVANDVIVSPITGTGSSACVVSLAVALAQGTGGTAFSSIDPATELANFVEQLVENACRGDGSSSCEDEQLRVFDDSDALDDQFDVFVDGQFLFRTPIGGGATNPCINDIPPGRHTLRIEFVQDVDDPDGLDPDQNGTYGIVLLGGVIFVDGPGVETDVTASGDLFPQGALHDYTIDVEID